MLRRHFLPDGTFVEETIASGVVGLSLPTPLEWMDRLSPERQAVVLDALDLTSEGRRFQKRMLAAREIDVANAEVIAGVGMLRAAGVLTAKEAEALLA